MFVTKRKKIDPSAAKSGGQPAQTVASIPSIAASGQDPRISTSFENDDVQRQTAIALRRSAALAQIITVLMRSPQHRHLALADLEWLVFPPLLTGQFGVAHLKSKDGKRSIPAATVLWAGVSPEVDKRLAENLSSPVRLRPGEWKSGDALWLIEAVGDGRILSGLLKQLSDATFKGKDVKIRVRGNDGKVNVQSLRATIASQTRASVAQE